MLYQFEACRDFMPIGKQKLSASAFGSKSFDQSFAPVQIQEAVRSIYQLDDLLQASTERDADTDALLPLVANVLHLNKQCT